MSAINAYGIYNNSSIAIDLENISTKNANVALSLVSENQAVFNNETFVNGTLVLNGQNVGINIANIKSDVLDLKNKDDSIDSSINDLKFKDIQHDNSLGTLNTSLGAVQTQVGALETLTVKHTADISALGVTVAANTGGLATVTTGLATTNVEVAKKINKSSFEGVSVIYKDEFDNVQLLYDQNYFTNVAIFGTNTRLFTLQPTFQNLPDTIANTSNDLDIKISNTSNDMAKYTSNTSNTLYENNSNSSNSLFAYTSNTSNSLFAYSSNNSNSLSNLINTKQNKLIFNSPLSNFQDTISINTGSSISIDGSGNLSVASSVQSKWMTNGTDIYNNNIGNIGIGGSIPLYKLDVNGAIKTNSKLNIIDNGIPSSLLTRQINLIGTSAVMKIFRTAASGNPAVELRWKNGVPANDSDSTYWWDFYLGTSGNPSAANKFTIRDRSPNGVMANNKDRFTIDTNGNVIIGSAGSTSYKLDVSGNVNSSGEYFKNGMNISNIFVSSNVLSNTSNTLANYDNLYNKPVIFTKSETSNIFVTSNVLSNTSNTLANYDNLYNKPDIFTKTETSNNFYTKSQINTNLNTNLFLVGKTTADSPESILEVSDNIRVQKNATAGDYVKLSSGLYSSISLEGNENTNVSANNSVNISAINNNVNINALSATGDINMTANDINLQGSTTTQKLNVDSGFMDFNDTIFNVSNCICVRKITPTSTKQDELVVSIGHGNPSSVILLEILETIGLLYVELFSGLKVYYNNNVLLSAMKNLVMYSQENVTIMGKSIILKGKVNTSGQISRKSPIYFTTNRTFNLNSVTYSAYDIDLSLYVNKVELDGINHRHFRIRLFFANGRLDFQWTPTTYQVYMTSYNTLSIKAYSSRYGESQLDQPDGIGYFLYRNSIDIITFCASTFLFGSTVKVYFVIEDLL